MSLDISVLVSKFQTKLQNHPNISSAVGLITTGMKMLKEMGVADAAKQKELLLQLLHRVAAGKDGVSGTADDLISPKILEQLNMLLNTQMATDIISTVHGAMVEIVPKVTGCLSCFKSTSA